MYILYINLSINTLNNIYSIQFLPLFTDACSISIFSILISLSKKYTQCYSYTILYII